MGKLDPEFKALLVADLRSGEHLQGHHYLRRIPESENKTQWCCLGRVAELANPNCWMEDCLPGGEVLFEWKGSASIILESDTAQLGWTDGDIHRLVTLNDGWEYGSNGPRDSKGDLLFPDGLPNGGRSHTFEEIADYIEANF